MCSSTKGVLTKGRATYTIRRTNSFVVCQLTRASVLELDVGRFLFLANRYSSGYLRTVASFSDAPTSSDWVLVQCFKTQLKASMKAFQANPSLSLRMATLPRPVTTDALEAASSHRMICYKSGEVSAWFEKPLIARAQPCEWCTLLYEENTVDCRSIRRYRQMLLSAPRSPGSK